MRFARFSESKYTLTNLSSCCSSNSSSCLVQSTNYNLWNRTPLTEGAEATKTSTPSIDPEWTSEHPSGKCISLSKTCYLTPLFGLFFVAPIPANSRQRHVVDLSKRFSETNHTAPPRGVTLGSHQQQRRRGQLSDFLTKKPQNLSATLQSCSLGSFGSEAAQFGWAVKLGSISSSAVVCGGCKWRRGFDIFRF